MAGARRPQGTRVDGFPPLRRASWDFSAVADGEAYLLRRGRDFEVAVESLAAAVRRWARQHGYAVTTRSQFDEDREERPKVGLYVRFERAERPGKRA